MKRKPTKKQRQKALFQDKLYNILRLYQVGHFNATSGVIAGHLDIALTRAMAAITKAFEESQQ